MMASNFMPHTCSPIQCKPFLERMLSACIGQHVPDVPSGNSLAGSILQEAHVSAIIDAVKMAGCKVKTFAELSALAPKEDPTENPMDEEDIAERSSLKQLRATGNVTALSPNASNPFCCHRKLRDADLCDYLKYRPGFL